MRGLVQLLLPLCDMDSILSQLLSFPPHPPPPTPLSDVEYDKQIRAVAQLLGGVPARKLTGGVSGGGDLLDVSHFSSGGSDLE